MNFTTKFNIGAAPIETAVKKEEETRVEKNKNTIASVNSDNKDSIDRDPIKHKGQPNIKDLESGPEIAQSVKAALANLRSEIELLFRNQEQPSDNIQRTVLSRLEQTVLDSLSALEKSLIERSGMLKNISQYSTGNINRLVDHETVNISKASYFNKQDPLWIIQDLVANQAVVMCTTIHSISPIISLTLKVVLPSATICKAQQKPVALANREYSHSAVGQKIQVAKRKAVTVILLRMVKDQFFSAQDLTRYGIEPNPGPVTRERFLVSTFQVSSLSPKFMPLWLVPNDWTQDSYLTIGVNVDSDEMDSVALLIYLKKPSIPDLPINLSIQVDTDYPEYQLLALFVHTVNENLTQTSKTFMRTIRMPMVPAGWELTMTSSSPALGNIVVWTVWTMVCGIEPNPGPSPTQEVIVPAPVQYAKPLQEVIVVETTPVVVVYDEQAFQQAKLMFETYILEAVNKSRIPKRNDYSLYLAPFCIQDDNFFSTMLNSADLGSKKLSAKIRQQVEARKESHAATGGKASPSQAQARKNGDFIIPSRQKRFETIKDKTLLAAKDQEKAKANRDQYLKRKIEVFRERLADQAQGEHQTDHSFIVWAEAQGNRTVDNVAIQLFGSDYTTFSDRTVSCAHYYSMLRYARKSYLFFPRIFKDTTSVIFKDVQNPIKAAIYSHFFSEFSDVYYDDTNVLETDAIAWNQKMHSQNGNPIPSSYTDILSRPEFIALYSDETASGVSRPTLDLCDILNRIMMPNYNLPSYYQNSYLEYCIASTVVTQLNQYVQSVLSLPITDLYPRQVRGGLGLPLGQPVAPLIFSRIMPYPWFGSELKTTAVGDEFLNATVTQISSISRPNSITGPGWFASDMIKVAKSNSSIGWNPDAMVLRLLLFMLSLSHAPETLLMAPAAMVGVSSRQFSSNTINAIDGYTQARSAPPLIRASYNNSPVYNESISNTSADGPTFPIGNTRGSIAWHVTTDTVPASETYIYCPSSFCSAGESQVYLAIFCAAWAVWPFFQATYSVRTMDSAQANTEFQLYTSLYTLVHVPGSYTLNIILPHNPNASVPTTYAAASAASIINNPRFGPVGWANFLADAQMQINAMGQPYLSYPLSGYLVSWLTVISPSAINLVLARLQNYANIQSVIYRNLDLIALIVPIYPGGTANLPPPNQQNTPFRVVNDQNLFWQSNYAQGQRTTQTAGNLPATVITPPYAYVPDTDYIAWNKLATTLFTPIGGLTETNLSLPSEITTPMANKYMLIRSMALATVWNVLFSGLRVPASVWSSLVDNNLQLNALMSYLRGFFQITPTNGRLCPVPRELDMRSLFSSTLGYSPGTVTIDDQVGPVSAFSLLAYNSRQYNNGVIIGPAGAFVATTELTPNFLADVWTNLITIKTPLSASMIVPQNAYDVARGFVESNFSQYITDVGGATYYSIPTEFGMLSAFSDQTSFRNESDKALWNFTIANLSGLTYYVANNAVFVVPGQIQGSYSCQRQRINQVTLIATAEAFTYPSAILNNIAVMNVNGISINLAVPQAQNTQISRIIAGKQIMPIEAWLLSGMVGPAITITPTICSNATRLLSLKSSTYTLKSANPKIPADNATERLSQAKITN